MLEPLPSPGDTVEILVVDKSGTLAAREALHSPTFGWIDATTLLPVEDDVLSWECSSLSERRNPSARDVDTMCLRRSDRLPRLQ